MKYLPEPESFYAKTPNGYSSNYSLTITPYSSLQWKDLVPQYGIQVPEIVDMTHGKSKCGACNAVYAGSQPYCTAMAIFHKPDGRWHESRGYHYLYPSYERECGGILTWDLSDKFSEQVQFFSLLERIRRLPDLKYNPISKFQGMFPKGVAENLEIRILADDVSQIMIEIPKIHDALKQIANKMNSAGACLSFGF